jgi:hypothetical protein
MNIPSEEMNVCLILSHYLKMHCAIHWVWIFKKLVMDTLMKYKNTHLNHDICNNQMDYLKPIKFYRPIHMVSHPIEVPPKSFVM